MLTKAVAAAVMITAVTVTGASAPLAADCTQNLQTQIDATPAGGTLTLNQPCVYRESVAIRRSMTLDGGRVAEIRGSDVWSSWSATGQSWTSAQAVPSLPIAPGIDPKSYLVDVFQGSHPEQVFVDGSELVQTPNAPASGEFTLDGARHVMLGSDPTGHAVEVTTRGYWLTVGADNVTIQNFTMRHAASYPNVVSAITNNERAGFTLQDSILSDAHGNIVSINGGSNTRLLRNDISEAHQDGISSGNGSSGNIIQGNKVHDSGDWFDWQGVLGTAGGIKLTQQGGTLIDGNETWNNHGPGVWCDIGCGGPVTISNNRSHDNSGPGILYEVGMAARIIGNVVEHNGDVGIDVSSSNNADVQGNTARENMGGIRIASWRRSNAPAGCCMNDVVRGNTVYQDPAKGEPISIVGDANTSSNIAVDNQVFLINGSLPTATATLTLVPTSTPRPTLTQTVLPTSTLTVPLTATPTAARGDVCTVLGERNGTPTKFVIQCS